MNLAEKSAEIFSGNGCHWARSTTCVPTDTEIEERRRRTTSYAALLAVIVSGGYCILDLTMEVYSGAVINGLACLLYLLCASILCRPCGLGVRHILVWTGLIHIVCLTALVLGTRPGAHYFLICMGVIPAILFRDGHVAWKWFYMGIAMVGVCVIELGMIPEPGIYLRTGLVADIIRLSCIVLTTLFIFLVMRRYLVILDEAREALRREHERSEELLLNILPGSVATRLKRGESIADAFDEVTVLFADIVAFTPMASGTPPQKLVKILNEIFSAFDGMAETHSLEKIKTIGDAYMVAGGIPDRSDGHVKAVAAMGIDMMDWMTGYRKRTGLEIGLRIGIHTGPVVAGVIGAKKFIYDLWGDTVNLASRMESQGSRGQIQVTEAVYELLSGVYTFEKRGVLEVKGRGQMVTYWLRPGSEPVSEVAGFK